MGLCSQENFVFKIKQTKEFTYLIKELSEIGSNKSYILIKSCI